VLNNESLDIAQLVREYDGITVLQIYSRDGSVERVQRLGEKP
jgi:hypothetical protein